MHSNMYQYFLPTLSLNLGSKDDNMAQPGQQKYYIPLAAGVGLGMYIWPRQNNENDAEHFSWNSQGRGIPTPLMKLNW